MTLHKHGLQQTVKPQVGGVVEHLNQPVQKTQKLPK